MSPFPSTPTLTAIQIICAAVDNRDNFLYRSITPPVVHAETGVVCAVDGPSGGTWIGLNARTGLFACLTNIGGRGGPGGLSRGRLVLSFLTADRGEPNLPTLLARRKTYPGFNLMWGRVLPDDDDDGNREVRGRLRRVIIAWSFRRGRKAVCVCLGGLGVCLGVSDQRYPPVFSPDACRPPSVPVHARTGSTGGCDAVRQQLRLPRH